MTDQTRAPAERPDGREKRPSGRSPQRPIRIPDDAWYPAVARAKREGVPIAHVVTAFLRDYAEGGKP